MHAFSRSVAAGVGCAVLAVVGAARCSSLDGDIPSRTSDGGGSEADSSILSEASDGAVAGEPFGLDTTTPNPSDAMQDEAVDASNGPGADAGAGAAEAGDAPSADAAEEPPPSVVPPLPAVAPGHLRVWLTADSGVQCDAATGRVTRWADLSGNGASATSGTHLGPQCAARGHAYRGVSLLFFDAPSTPTNELAPYADGTLDVPLGFLAGAPYTIFVVERRWSDRAVNQGATLVGTDDSSLQCPADFGMLLCFGYVYYDNGAPALDNEQFCGQSLGLAGGGLRHPVAQAAQPPPSPLSFDMTWLDPSAGDAARQIWQDGIEIGTAIPSAALRAAVGGSIGRCWSASATGQTSVAQDMRYYGDIAEVLIFDAALSPADRTQMEQYLRSHWQL